MKIYIRHFTVLLLNIFLFLSTEQLLAGREFYVLYRGYHFIEEDGTTTLNKLAAKKNEAIESRAAKQLKEKNISLGDARDRILSLKMSPPLEAQSQILPSFYHHFIEKYVNSYTGFNEDIKNQNSQFRKKLASLGLNFDCNFLVSTSLHSLHAFRYGAGGKLYSHGQLRKLPLYNAQLKPINKYVGYVDVMIIPRGEFEQTGGLFVIEEFAKHNIKLCYHYSKNLTAEEEVTFPLFIPGTYHKLRIGIPAPDFSSDYISDYGMTQRSFNIFKKKLGRTNLGSQERNEVEVKVIDKVAESLSEIWENKIKDIFKQKNDTILFSSPANQFFFRQQFPLKKVGMKTFQAGARDCPLSQAAGVGGIKVQSGCASTFT